jgi:hypothetical protein
MARVFISHNHIVDPFFDNDAVPIQGGEYPQSRSAYLTLPAIEAL